MYSMLKEFSMCCFSPVFPSDANRHSYKTNTNIFHFLQSKTNLYFVPSFQRYLLHLTSTIGASRNYLSSKKYISSTNLSNLEYFQFFVKEIFVKFLLNDNKKIFWKKNINFLLIFFPV